MLSIKREIMTDQLTDRQTDLRSHRDVILPTSAQIVSWKKSFPPKKLLLMSIDRQIHADTSFAPNSSNRRDLPPIVNEASGWLGAKNVQIFSM